MRSRVIPGSSPTIDRRLFVNRLNNVDLPTLGRPTIATSGSASAPGRAGITDLRYVGKALSRQTTPLPVYRRAPPLITFAVLYLSAEKSTVISSPIEMVRREHMP